jgi:hypothetical protein
MRPVVDGELVIIQRGSVVDFPLRLDGRLARVSLLGTKRLIEFGLEAEGLGSARARA